MPENPSLSSVGMNGILIPKSCLQDGGFLRYNPMYEKDEILERSSYETQTEVSYRMDTKVPEAHIDWKACESLKNPAAASGRSEWMAYRGIECDVRSYTYVGTDWA